MAAVATIFFTPSQTTLPIPEPGQRNGNNTRSGVQVLAENLDVPWAIDIAEDGRLFFTERTGKIMAIDKNGSLISDPVAYINVMQNGESGLLGLALHPNFTENHLLYVYHTYSNDSAVLNQVLMLTENDNKIVESKVIIDNIPASDRNDGGRIKFGPDGKLYIATGDARSLSLPKMPDPSQARSCDLTLTVASPKTILLKARLCILTDTATFRAWHGTQ